MNMDEGTKPVRGIVHADTVAPEHHAAIDGATYAGLAGACDSALAQTSAEYLRRYLEEMAPRNPAERMLAVQMLWQHTRLARLLGYWDHTTNVKHMKALDSAIDAGMNVSRQQAATWAALRSPRPVQIIAGRQVNVAGQQIVANAGAGPDCPAMRPASNEQGCFDATRVPKALPAEPERFGFPADFCRPREALDPIHRPADGGGQGSIRP